MTTPSPGPWWLRWLPAETRRGVMRRALIVWGVAAIIALLQHALDPARHTLGLSFVYSYAISTAIWLCSDPLRIALHRWLDSQAPHYWALNVRTASYLALSVILGYAVGTTVGDAVAGHSTWELVDLSPRRFWGFLLGTVGISAGFVFFFYHREKTQALERIAAETRLKLLESQLEPHMLFNTLANLRVLIGVDPVRATAMLDRLNDYLRATLAASRSDGGAASHTLALEFVRLRDYLELMAVRMGSRLRFSLELPASIANHPVPALLLQPLVENAIRHGIEPCVSGGDVVVSAWTDNEQLHLRVRDTGAGTESPPRNGFGLSQVRERLATAFGTRGRLEWTSAPGQGTSITLCLPLQAGTA